MNIDHSHVELPMELGYTARGAQFLCAGATLVFDQGIQYLETEPDRAKFFSHDLGVTKTFLRADIHKGGFGSCSTSRYFEDKDPPLLVTPFSAVLPVVTFSYRDSSPETMSGFPTRLVAFMPLYRQLDSFPILFVSLVNTECDQNADKARPNSLFETHLVAQRRATSVKQAVRVNVV